VLKMIVRQALEPLRPGSRLLLLLAMAGVCKHWRELALEVPADLPIAFDGSAENSLMGGTPFRFRRCALAKKEGTFLAGASLLRGEEREEGRERKDREGGRRGDLHRPLLSMRARASLLRSLTGGPLRPSLGPGPVPPPGCRRTGVNTAGGAGDTTKVLARDDATAERGR